MNFREALKKEFLVCLEVIPPKGKELDVEIEKIRGLHVDYFTAVDSPLSHPTMHPIAVCKKIQEQLGKEAIMHFTCRDRNKIEIEAILLAAHALGINNILALTGDKAKDAKAVFEFSSVGLIEFIRKLNEKHGMDFFVGAGMNANAADLENEIYRTKKKIDAGAKFIITQPCFDVERIKKIKEEISPVLIGVLLVSDKKSAEFCSKIPGISISNDLIKAIDAGRTIEFYKKLIEEIKAAGVNGICLMPIRDYEIAKELI